VIVLERVERRILGAVRFVDAATQLWITDSLEVSAPGVKLIRNGHGAYVIAAAPGLDAHTQAFTAPPAAPAIGSVSVTLTASDPSGRYLPRAVTLALPRDPDPTKGDQPGSLFQAVPAPLYPSPAGPIAAGAAIVRASISAQGSGAPLANALVMVTRKSDNVVLARGLSDARGEALAVVPGVPVMTWDNAGGSVLAPETNVTVSAVYDPALSGPPDPESLEARRATLKTASVDSKLASRREQPIALQIDLS